VNTSTKALRWAALAVLTIAATTAHAASFDLNYTGSFNSSTTLGGVALGADTPFSIVATFDSSVNYEGYGGGVGLYEVTALSLSLPGNTYTAIPDINLCVLMTDATYNSIKFSTGLYNVNEDSPFYSNFVTQSNSSFDVAAPSANTYSGHVNNISSALFTGVPPLSISLVGVTGGLANLDFGSTTPTASISAAAVPEPAEYAAVTGLALGVFALVQRRRQAAGR